MAAIWTVAACIITSQARITQSAFAAGDTTFTCRTYGYSVQVPDGWQLMDRNCAGTVTKLLVTNTHDAIVGVQIVGAHAFGLGFQQLATQELGQLGIPASAVAFGWQQSGKIRYDMAMYSPNALSATPALTAYVVGTEQNGVKYAFEGYITSTLPAVVTTLASQMRGIYSSIHYFKGTDTMFRQGVPARQAIMSGANAASGSTTASLVGLVLLVGFFALGGVGGYVLYHRRSPLQRA